MMHPNGFHPVFEWESRLDRANDKCFFSGLMTYGTLHKYTSCSSKPTNKYCPSALKQIFRTVELALG